MPIRDVVVVGASAGGVEALRELVHLLPADFPAAILVVVHIAPSASSALPSILARAGRVPIAHAQSGMAIEPGHVYVAPPDHHLVIHNDQLRLTRGPRVNGHRPAIDPLFFSAARWRGARVVSVVLSGVLDDGTVGTAAVARAGGVTVAQDPTTALYPQMPRNAIELGGAQHVVPIGELAEALVRWVREEVRQEGGPMKPDIEGELEPDEEAAAAPQGPASSFTCPDCHGALWELRDAQLVRYRCRIGHSYSSETLLAQQSEKLEDALWAGYRALEESAALAKKLCDGAIARSSPDIAARYQARYEDALERARTLREVLERGQLYSADQD